MTSETGPFVLLDDVRKPGCARLYTDPAEIIETRQPHEVHACLERLRGREAAGFLQMNLPAFYAYRRRHHIPNAIKGRALRFWIEDLLIAQRRIDDNGVAAGMVDYAELGRLRAHD